MASVTHCDNENDLVEPLDSAKDRDVVLGAHPDNSVPLSGSPLINPGRTLLPAPVAQAVSFAARSTSLALRVGTLLGSFGLGAAKATTLSSLELGRGILEGILSRAGKEVVARSGGELGRADAETVLEKSLESLHHAMTQVVFWTATGFQLTSTSLGMISDVSQLLLSSLDQFFGSTDSSRAIASIITLIRREFRNPATGAQGERVGVVDLIMGLCGLAYLQQWCRRLVHEENRRLRVDEMVWDVVVLNTGARVDVHDDSHTRARLLAPEGDGSIAGTIRTSVAAQDDNDMDIELAEVQLKQQILETLPAGARVSLSTTVSTTRTITADIYGLQVPYIDPPPGFELVEFEALRPSTAVPAQLEDSSSGGSINPITSGVADVPPAYRVVYRLKRTRGTTTHVRREDESEPTGMVEPAAEPDNMTLVQECESPDPSATLHRDEPVASQTSNLASTTAANQKRVRTPPNTVPTSNPTPPSPPKQRRLASSSLKTMSAPPLPARRSSTAEKKSLFRNPLRKVSVPRGNTAKQTDPDTTRSRPGTATHLSVPAQPTHKPAGSRTPPRSPVDTQEHPRTSSRSSFVAVHETRRDSLISQTDTYAIHSPDANRSRSSTLTRTESLTGGAIVRSRSEKGLPDALPPSPTKDRRRARSHTHTPSIFTLKAKGSDSSLVLHPYQSRGIYDEAEALDTLRHSGMVAGIFPKYHLLRNLDRYMRFASASYGSSFLKFMKIGREMPILRALDDTHHELRSFAHHTQSDAESILLSSFVDPQGGSDATGSTNTGVPMVHYISLDHDSKAVVLACRGTLGFEDVLADMTCDYDDLLWQGSTYKVHKGIHASARRLLYGGDGRVLLTLRQALEEFQDYGVVLTGHSLGGAVTALLGVMLSEPASTGAAFVTTSNMDSQRLLTQSSLSSFEPSTRSNPIISLPPGRPIHVYAYGPPATMTASLRLATRGLITSVVHGHDLVPYLSLGVLHDLQAVALAFKTDNSDAKSEVRRRVWEAFQTGLAARWYSSSSQGGGGGGGGGGAGRRFMPGGEDEGEEWAWAALKVLRASMMGLKLVPPGEVFVVESSAVLRRDTFVATGGGNGSGVGAGQEEHHLGKPARRVVLKYVRNVEAHFREVSFGASMLIDHSPGKYEDALRRLRWGVMEGYS